MSDQVIHDQYSADHKCRLLRYVYQYVWVSQYIHILCTDLKINMEYFSGHAFTYTQTHKSRNGYIVKYTIKWC